MPRFTIGSVAATHDTIRGFSELEQRRCNICNTAQVLPERVPPLSIWETEDRYEWHAAMWRQVDGFVSGATPIGDRFALGLSVAALGRLVGLAGALFVLALSWILVRRRRAAPT